MDHKENCLLYAYGELGRAEAAEFERHLEGCAACRERLAAARLTHQLAPATLETPAARLVEGALAGVRARAWAAGRPARRFQPWGLLLAAGLACLAGVGVFVYMSQTPPTPPRPVRERPAPEVPAVPASSMQAPAPRPVPVRASRRARPKLAARDLSASFKLRQPDESVARIRFAAVAIARPSMPSVVLRQPAPLRGLTSIGR